MDLKVQYLPVRCSGVKYKVTLSGNTQVKSLGYLFEHSTESQFPKAQILYLKWKYQYIIQNYSVTSECDARKTGDITKIKLRAAERCQNE